MSFGPFEKLAKISSSTIQENSCSKRREFPKIQEIDPDKKKKKKKELQQAHVDIFSLENRSIDAAKQAERVALSKANLDFLYKAILEAVIFQKESDRVKTTLILNSKIFGKIDVSIITHSTNPYSFHIKIMGNEKLSELSVKHVDALEKSLKEALPKTQIHLDVSRLKKSARFTSREKKALYKQKEVVMVTKIKDTPT